MEKKNKEYAKPFAKVVLLDDSDIICMSGDSGSETGPFNPFKGRGRNEDYEDYED